MTAPSEPTPEAEALFDVGFRLAAALGPVIVIASYVLGVLSLQQAIYTLALLYPVALVFVSLVLAVRLGFPPDPTHLRRVSDDDAVGYDPWERWE